ncbi:MAG: acyltransferase family protein [Spirochaetes bacterium]|nr:acyltransferase family protein [Spirochaetota bacterium]
MQQKKKSTELKTETASVPRLFYIDWLRAIAILAVFLYHCNRFFDLRNYPIQPAVRSIASAVHRDFSQLWMMPLFFVISGAAVYFSLNSRSIKNFIKDKFLRLLVPLVTIGIFIIAPPQIYLERLTDARFTGSFLQWYPHYFDGIYPYGNFAFQGMHLWYLLELFLYSLIFLFIFIPAGKNRKSILSRISCVFETPWRLILILIPTAAAGILTESLKMGPLKMMGGWDPLSYLVFFLCGYIIFSNTRTLNIIRRYSGILLAAACILTALHLCITFTADSAGLSGVIRYNLELQARDGITAKMPAMSFSWSLMLVLRSAAAWLWILGLTGLTSKVLNFRNRILDYCNEAVLPFYILHQTILLAFGYYIIQWDTNNGIKYTAITVSSFAAVMIIYELFVRRFNVLRFLFGMKLSLRIKS